MKTLTILSAILDLLIIASFLFLPRTGMEAMGTGFLLLPLSAIRIVVAMIALFLSWRRRNWRLFAYTLVMLAVLGGLWKYGWNLKPTDKPLYKALQMKAREQAGKISDYKDQKKYDARRLIQKAGDADHARLCDLLAEKRDVGMLEGHLAKNLDLSKTCVTFEGDRVGPILHAVIHSYGTWPYARKRPPVDTNNLPSAVKLLLDHGADPNVRDRRGSTPLHYAIGFREDALVDLLLAGGACVFLNNDQDESPARMHASFRVEKKIRAAANDPAMVARCPDMYQTDGKKEPKEPMYPPDVALMRALPSGGMEAVTAALRRGADPNAVDRDGSTLQAAMRHCRDKALVNLQVLLVAGADVNLRNRRGETPLKIAADDCIRAVPFLMGHGADPTLADNAGDTALHEVVRHTVEHAAPLIDALLQAGADINHANRHGQTPLIVMAYISSAIRNDMLPLLLARGADPNRQDVRGDTLLHILAAEKDRHDPSAVVRLLLSHGVDLEIRNRSHQTALMTAVARRNVKVAKLLIEAGADMDVRSKRGRSLIGSLISCEPKKLAILELLVAAGADVAAASEDVPSPLVQAFYSHLYLDCLEPARILLTAGADPNRLDRNGTAPIHALAHWSKKDPGPAIDLLLAHGARIDFRNQQQMTALLLAGRHGISVAPMQALLDKGADPKAVDDRGNTLLHQMAMNAKPGGKDRLAFALAAGGDPAAVNHKGQTALDRARSTRNQAMIEALVALND